MLGCVINAVAFLTFPLWRPSPYPAPSMYSLKLNCSVSSTMLSTIIGILIAALVAPGVNVTLYRPGVKSAPATESKSR